MKIDWKKFDIKQTATVICEYLRKNNIDAALVGGACVSIYSKNQYVSGDLDFITVSSIKELTPILNKLGFHKKSGRHFENPDCNFFIEFPAPPLAIGNQPVDKLNILKNSLGKLYLLTPTDSVKDRLSGYFYWDDSQCLEQALMIAKNNKINLTKIRNWSKKENNLQKFKIFINKLQQNDK